MCRRKLDACKIANSINVIEHEERLKDYIDKRFDELQSSIENTKSSADSIDDAVCSIKSSIEKIEKDGVGSGKVSARRHYCLPSRLYPK